MMKLQDLDQRTLYPATLLDTDNQPLSIGEAQIYTCFHQGSFSPRDESILRSFRGHEAILEIHQGPKLALTNVRLCSSRPHFHFDFACA
jgi:hypothetical protein